MESSNVFIKGSTVRLTLTKLKHLSRKSTYVLVDHLAFQ